MRMRIFSRRKNEIQTAEDLRKRREYHEKLPERDRGTPPPVPSKRANDGSEIPVVMVADYNEPARVPTILRSDTPTLPAAAKKGPWTWHGRLKRKGDGAGRFVPSLATIQAGDTPETSIGDGLSDRTVSSADGANKPTGSEPVRVPKAEPRLRKLEPREAGDIYPPIRN